MQQDRPLDSILGWVLQAQGEGNPLSLVALHMHGYGDPQ